MYFDQRLVKAQADYKREQLKKSYPKRSPFDQKAVSGRDGHPAWLTTWAWLSLLNR